MNSTNYLIMENEDGNGNKKYYIVRKNTLAHTEETYCSIMKHSNDEYKYYDCDTWYDFADLSKNPNPSTMPKGMKIILSYIFLFLSVIAAKHNYPYLFVPLAALFFFLFFGDSFSKSITRNIYYFKHLECAEKVVRSYAPEKTNIVAVM